MFKILSWNVNGLRAAHKKGFLEWLSAESPDMVCLQEIKAKEQQLPQAILSPPGYHAFFHPAERLGYSGVALFTKQAPLEIKRGLGAAEFDAEGRFLEARFKSFTLIGVYFPNGQSGVERRRFKMDFNRAVLARLKRLRSQGTRLVICGDYNIAHKPVDLADPEGNTATSGFLPEERAWMDELISTGFLDTFRAFHSEPQQYTWWDQRTRARERNEGWRIDYHFVTEDLRSNLRDAFIRPETVGSDHCPVGILIDSD